MEENKFWGSPFVPPAVVLSLGLLVATIIGAWSYYGVRSFDNALSVIGSTKVRVSSDSAKWRIGLMRTALEYNLPGGYSRLNSDLVAVRGFLEENGIKSESVTVSPVSSNEMYKYSPSGDSGPREYSLNQNITVESDNPEKISGLAQKIKSLADDGIVISMNMPEYYYSKLSELRVSLLSDAIKDAKARASKIAESSGRRVGKLKSAASGIVQVLAPNSVEVTDYGSYDTSSLEKDVMVTVRATFFVR